MHLDESCLWELSKVCRTVQLTPASLCTFYLDGPVNGHILALKSQSEAGNEETKGTWKGPPATSRKIKTHPYPPSEPAGPAWGSDLFYGVAVAHSQRVLGGHPKTKPRHPRHPPTWTPHLPLAQKERRTAARAKEARE